MYSHEELISAVRAAGQDGKTFTVKDVRTQLGLEIRDKKEISRFRRRLRAFEKVAADQLEKLGDNSYRLRPGAFEQAAAVALAVAVEAEQQPLAASSPNASELDLEPTTGVFEAARPANQTAELLAAREASQPAPQATVALQEQAAAQPEPQAAYQAPAQPEPQPVYQASAQPEPQRVFQAPAQTAPQPNAQSAQQPAARSASVPRRALSVASALVSGALATSVTMSGKVRERSRNLREQLWSCLNAVPLRRHAIARLRGWAEGLRPLSNEVREQLHALRQRVTSSRRRAA